MGTDYHYGPPKYITDWIDDTPSELSELNDLYPYAKSGTVVEWNGKRYQRYYRVGGASHSGKTGQMIGWWDKAQE